VTRAQCNAGGISMCGFCGIFDLEKQAPVSETVLAKMNARIAHRGPDDCGTYIDRFLGFGHRRLSIIDVVNGRQPLSNEDGTVWIAYNGEIYNFKELRHDLVRKGHQFRTDCDTEVIVHAYEQYGQGCVSKFNGIFAFALWDQRREVLWLVRDRMGVKPLYYTIAGSTVVFGSEIKALLEHPCVTAEPDIGAVAEYLLCTSILDSKTMFRNIRSIPPGATLAFENGAMKERRYWAIEKNRVQHNGCSFEDCRDEIRDLLDSSVGMEAISDVPLGTLLSGGLDSSLVSAFAARHIDGRLKTFSMGYDKSMTLRPDDTDAHYASIVANAYGTDHTELLFQPEEYFDVLERVTWHVEKPVELTSPSLYLLYRGVKPQATVVMSGEGADELFAGYYFFLDRCRTERPVEFPWAPYLSEVSALLDPSIDKQVEYTERVRSTLAGDMAAFETEDHVNKVLYLFLKYYLVEMLERLDKTSMAWGVESRVPFLDHRIVSFAANMPSRYKAERGCEKRLLKSIGADMLPEPVVRRKKRPVPIPVDPKTVFDERNRANDLVQCGSSAIGSYFDKRKVDDFFHKRGEFAATDNLALYRTSHALIALNAWHRAFGAAA
jgi:asparagine synthase (glutamine-hydrolysing)